MSEPTDTPDFDRAEFDQPDAGAIVCTSCQQPPVGTYFGLNGQSICAACLEQARAGQQSSFAKALALGICAGAVGALVYYGIREATGYDLALITILLGSAVGVGVRMGAGSSTSMIYRLMAVALAWLAMTSTYVPDAAEMIAGEAAQVSQENPASADAISKMTPAGLWIASVITSLMIPFLLVLETEVIGLLIFGFGLWEAWRRSAAAPFVVTGPFSA